MNSRIECRIKQSVITVAIAFNFYVFQGIALNPCQAKSTEVKPTSNADTVSLQQTTQLSRPSIIDILPRLYTVDEIYSRFKEHEFRATNDFKNCRLMVTGKIVNIGTLTFSNNPLVTLGISGSNEGLKFIFENTDYDNDKVAALNVGDTVIIEGWNVPPGPPPAVLLEHSKIMTNMISKKKMQMLAVNGGVYDREICHK